MSGRARSSVAPTFTDATGQLMAPPAIATSFHDHYIARQDPPIGPHLPIQPGPPHEDIDAPFTARELAALLDSPRSTAPGHDDIPYPMLHHLPPPARDFLLSVYNVGWLQGVIPPTWKHGVVIPICKPGRSPTNPSHFRPITLLPTLAKVWERLILPRLHWFLDTRRWWSPHQYGGLPGRRAEGALAHVVSCVQNAFNTRSSVAMLFLDVEGAFDALPLSTLAAALSTAHLPPRMSAWLTSFIYGRTACVRVSGALSDSFPLTRGVPQGAVLSPVLYNAGTNNFASSVPAALRVQFIDDLGIGAVGATPSRALDSLSRTLPALKWWATATGVTFGAAKTFLIIFTRRRRGVYTLRLSFLDQLFTPVPSVRYLGVLLDSALRWKRQVSHLRTAALQFLPLLRTVSGPSWGASRSLLRRLLVAILLPRLLFAAPFYRDAAASTLATLDVAVHSSVRFILGCPPSTAIPALYAEIGLLPPALTRDLRSTQVAYSLAAASSLPPAPANSLHLPWPAGPPLAQVIQHLPSYFPTGPLLLAPRRPPTTPPWRYAPLRIMTTLPFRKGDLSPHNEDCLDQWLRSQPPFTVLYTDASVRPGDVTAGFVCPQRGDSIACQLPDHLPIFDAELLGLVFALHFALSTLTPGPLLLCTDSLSALTYLSSDAPPTAGTFRGVVYSLVHSLTLAHTPVTFLWVPSHSAIPGNDSADHLVTSLRPLPWVSMALPAPCFQHRSKALYHALWDHQWSVQTTFLQSLRPSLTISCITSFPDPLLHRILTLARVGRLRTNVLRSRWHPHLSPMCPHCPSVAHSLPHILMHCPVTSPPVLVHLPPAFRALQPSAALPRLLGIGPLTSRLPLSTYIAIARTLLTVHRTP